MSRTILRCNNCMFQKAVCVFSKLEFDEKGKHAVPEYNCMIGKEDQYNIFPRCNNKDGYWSWQEMEAPDKHPSPWKFANRMFQWESTTPHYTTGDELNINRHDENPLYHIEDYNAPINMTQGLGEDELANVIGSNELSLTSSRWHGDIYGEPKRVMGHKNVEYCTGLYGTVDKKNKIVLHRSMKDWFSSVPWWKNYTNIKPLGKKRLINIFTSTDEIIEEFCEATVEDTVILARVLESILYIKSGKYINLPQLLKANQLPEDIIKKITSTISTKNPDTIHVTTTGRYNVEKVRDLYRAIRNGVIKASPFMSRVYRANIANYILNDIDGLAKLDLYYVTDWNFKPHERYWYAIEIIAYAVKDGIIRRTKNLPEWIKKLARDNNKLKLKSEFNPNFVAPPVVTVRSICRPTLDQKTAYKSFTNMIKSVDSITSTELLYVWKYWSMAHKKNKAELFWNYIINLSNEIDIHDILSSGSRETNNNFADQLLGMKLHMSSFIIKDNDSASSLYWDTDNNNKTAQVAIGYNDSAEYIELSRDLGISVSDNSPADKALSAVHYKGRKIT